MSQSLPRLRAAIVFVAVVFVAGFVQAAHVELKNGLIIEGNAIKLQTVSTKLRLDTGGNNEVYPLVLVDSGMVRYILSERRLADINKDQDLGTLDLFKIKRSLGTREQVPEFVGPPSAVTEFDANGRRVITYNTRFGAKPYQQVITEVGPKVIKVSTIGLAWDFSLATNSIRPERLDEVIRKVTDQTKPADRLTIARFYLQAGRYLEALRELETIAKDFPDQKERVDEFALEARQQLAEQLLKELDNRRSRGQHELAYTAAKQFPTEKIQTGTLRRIRDFIGEYDAYKDERERALMLLGELQGKIEDAGQRELLEALRSEVSEQLRYESLSRLRPFLKQSADEALKPDEKLSLAYSGWLLGENAAIESLSKTLNLWKARFLMLSYLRETDETKRQQLLADLTRTEGVGPQAVLGLIPNLPAILESSDVRFGQASEIVVNPAQSGLPADTPEVRYHILLPQEYSPQRSYPLIVSLRPVERTPEWMLRWWGGNADDPLQAQRHGYIVIAPAYLDVGAKEYTYSALSHSAVLQSIRDVRKRFSIDSDRIYLSGHGAGGDAALDIGLAHADEFAGVISVTGRFGALPKHLTANAKWTSLYIISGELDGDVFEKNAPVIQSLLLSNRDVLLAEYVGRGSESYYSEIHKLFGWMEAHKRAALPTDFEMQSMRLNDNRFFWIKGHTLPSATPVGRVPVKTPPTKAPLPIAPQTKSKQYSGLVLSGADTNNTIEVKSPAKSHTIWLTPEITSFEKRLRVNVNNSPKFNDFVEPSIPAMLEDLRLRGDRQRVFQAKLEL